MIAEGDQRVMNFVRDFIPEGQRRRSVVSSLATGGQERLAGIIEGLSDLDVVMESFVGTLNELASFARGGNLRKQSAFSQSRVPFGKLAKHDLLIDIGSANTAVYECGHGLVLREPSVLTFETKGGHKHLVAVGENATLLDDSLSSPFETVRPMRYGAVRDFDAAKQMVRYFVSKARERSEGRKRKVLVSMPYASSLAERRAILDGVMSGGAFQAGLIAEPIAAAIGAGMPVTEPVGSMIVNIGSASTEVSVLTLGDLVYAKTIRAGGGWMDEAISRYVLKRHNILIDQVAAEWVKTEIGSARMPDDGHGATATVHGRNLADGAPREFQVSQVEIVEAVGETVDKIIGAVINALEDTPPDLAKDVVDRGVMLTGGGALLNGLDSVIADGIGLRVSIASNPEGSTFGLAEAMKGSRKMQKFIQSSIVDFSPNFTDYNDLGEQPR